MLARHPPDPLSARTLPADAYGNPLRYRAECERIFRKEWILVGCGDQLRRPGDYLALDLVDEPLVIVRGQDNKVRALSSVCRHRYMPLVGSGTGSAACFNCPYHAWRYELDGRLSSAPFMGDVKGFEHREHSLPSFALEEWDGLFFVSLDPNPSPLAPKLEPVRKALERYHFSTGRQVAFDNRVWSCNWKVAVENASECYHHMGTHREMLDSIWPAKLTHGAEGGPGYAVHFTPARGNVDWGIAPNNINLGLLPADLNILGIYTLFPNALVINAGPLVLWFSFLPEGVGRCRFLNGYLAPAVLADAGLVDADKVQRLMMEINDQDTPIVEGVQRGIASRHATPGMLSHREPALANFYAYLRRMLED